MNVLVTGGAGYIGSHAVKILDERGYGVVCLDNLVKGHRENVVGGVFYEGAVQDKGLVREICTRHGIEAVMHFAAYSLVGESVEMPINYYENNVCNTLKLVESVLDAGAKYLIYSSSAGVYGEPTNIPITEDAPCEPTNPYGRTKLYVEGILNDIERARGLRYVSLRYFNAAGAHPDGAIGEDHDPETHLIPIVLDVALGKRESVTVFGNDWHTRDGTCIRDYIHVCDLIDAHILALEYLLGGGKSTVFNLGNSKGYTVKEVIDTVSQVTGRSIKVEIGPRRLGDPAILVASSDKIVRELGWRPKWASLEDIVETAWRWHRIRFEK